MQHHIPCTFSLLLLHMLYEEVSHVQQVSIVHMLCINNNNSLEPLNTLLVCTVYMYMYVYLLTHWCT